MVTNPSGVKMCKEYRFECVKPGRESSNENWVWRTQATQALVIYEMEEQDVCVPTSNVKPTFFKDRLLSFSH